MSDMWGMTQQPKILDPKILVLLVNFFTGSPTWSNFYFWETTEIALFMLIRNRKFKSNVI